MGRVTALWPESQSATLLQCESKLSTVDLSGHITSRTLTRVRVRVRVRTRFRDMSCVTAL